MRQIAQANGRDMLKMPDGTTKDIIAEIIQAVPEVVGQVREFSQQFPPTYEGLRALHDWVKGNIRYEEDPPGVQWVREPARLWRDKVGDCKSFTLFIAACLQNMGVPFTIRFASYDPPKSTYTHVYPVAHLGKQNIVLDAVYIGFDTEKPVLGKKDYKMADIFRLSGIGDANELDKYVSDVKAATANISPSLMNNDLTKMSEGELARWASAQVLHAQADTSSSPSAAGEYRAAAKALESGNISGIGSINNPHLRRAVGQYIQDTAGQNAPAFEAPVLLVTEDQAARLQGIHGIGSIGDWFKEKWAQLVNFIFKEGLPLASPFFLFVFLKKKFTGKTEARRNKQAGVLAWVAQAGKFSSPEAALAVIRAGIIKKMGKQPEEVLNTAAGAGVSGANIGGIGLISAILAAIGVVVDIIKKIVSFFKKSSPSVSQDDAPELDAMKFDMVPDAAPPTTPPTTSIPRPTAATTPTSSEGNNTLLIGVALAAVAALALK